MSLVFRLFVLAGPALGQNLQTWLSSVASLPLDEDSCPGSTSSPTDAELDFASEPLLKYMSYDTRDSNTWVPLSNLSSCLKSVAGRSWLGNSTDLLEAFKLVYVALGNIVNGSAWQVQGFIEYQPILADSTVLKTSPGFTLPMSSFAVSAKPWLQQPCNAFSNAAFFELGILVCSSQVTDFGGNWAWRDEMIAAGALMAFGSFAMHGFPDNSTYDTITLDTLSMDVAFYILHQALVRSWAVQPSDPALAPILNLMGYGDSRVMVQNFQKLLSQDSSTWKNTSQSMKATTPTFRLSAIGLIMVGLRAILNDELFGSSALQAYAFTCSSIVKALMDAADQQATIQAFCLGGSSFGIALNTVKWRSPLSILTSLSNFIDTLKLFVQAMYWQEGLVKPVTYLSRLLNTSSINTTHCWRQTHANWHRTAAQMMKKLLSFVVNDVPVQTIIPPLSVQQKQDAWSNVSFVAASFVNFAKALEITSKADSINVCRVFKAAKEAANRTGISSATQVIDLMAPERVNSLISEELLKYDPFSWDSIPDGDVADPTGICNYKYVDVVVNKVAGFSKLALDSLNVKTEYMPQSDWNSTVIRSVISMSSCPTALDVSVTATLRKQGGKGGILCSKTDWKTKVSAKVIFKIKSVQAFGEVNMQQVFSGSTGLNAGCSKANLDISEFTLTDLDITNFVGETALRNTVNFAMKQGLANEVEKMLEAQILKALNAALIKAAQDVGKRPLNSKSRRLAICQSISSSAGGTISDTQFGHLIRVPVIVSLIIFWTWS